MVCIYHSVLAQSGWKMQAITGHTNTVVAHQPLVPRFISCRCITHVNTVIRDNFDQNRPIVTNSREQSKITFLLGPNKKAYNPLWSWRPLLSRLEL